VINETINIPLEDNKLLMDYLIVENDLIKITPRKTGGRRNKKTIRKSRGRRYKTLL
jgi:hypothetical protein